MITIDEIKSAFVVARMNGMGCILLQSKGVRMAVLKDLLEQVEFSGFVTEFDPDWDSEDYIPFFDSSRWQHMDIAQLEVIHGEKVMAFHMHSAIVLTVGYQGFSRGLDVSVTADISGYTDAGAPVLHITDPVVEEVRNAS